MTANAEFTDFAPGRSYVLTRNPSAPELPDTDCSFPVLSACGNERDRLDGDQVTRIYVGSVFVIIASKTRRGPVERWCERVSTPKVVDLLERKVRLDLAVLVNRKPIRHARGEPVIKPGEMRRWNDDVSLLEINVNDHLLAISV